MTEKHFHFSDSDLYEYLDDALPESERDRFQAHLGTCQTCRAQLDEVQALFAAVEAAEGEVSLDRDLSAGVLDAITPPNTQAVTGILRWGLALQAILGIVILAIALLLFEMAGFNWSIPAFQIPEEFTVIPTVFSTDLAMIVTNINSMYAEGLSLLREFAGSPASMIGWAACIGIVFLLWVTGNTFLLNPRSQKE